MIAQAELPISVTSSARPFLKWAGGKARLTSTLIRMTPQNFNAYFEPFLGGGAFFFALRPARAFLNDLNCDLIQCYEVVRDAPRELLAVLDKMLVSADEFYRWRMIDPPVLDPITRAGRFIYLNKTCFNGLYRVNKRGRFNTPFGNYTSVSLADPANLLSASKVLKHAALDSRDYKEVLNSAHSGDFVYLDPPYLPLGGYSDFKRYTSLRFGGERDQQEIADIFNELDRRGCFVLLSNSKHPIIEQLYKCHPQITVSMPRFVNCKGDRRGNVEELLISNYEHSNFISGNEIHGQQADAAACDSQ